MKLRIYLFALMMMISGLTMAGSASAKNVLTKEQQEVRVTEIKNRVDQIRAMDFSKLDKEQRIGLKHELKDMKKELNHMGPVVVVFSVGALILIIILLLLLL